MSKRQLRSRGLTLIELMITLTLMALLLSAGVPAWQTWTANTRVRQAGETLQQGARMAQNEAMTRYRQVLWYRAAGCTDDPLPDDTGAFWALVRLPLAGEDATLLHCGALTDSALGVSLSGPTALCFNAAGRLSANSATGVGTLSCELSTDGMHSFSLSSPRANRPLRLRISLGGSLRLCDPAKIQSANAPDGCPT